MRVRVTLTLDLDVKNPGVAASVLEPMLAAMPVVEQFSWSMKGQDWFETKAERNGKRVSRTRAVRDRDVAY